MVHESRTSPKQVRYAVVGLGYISQVAVLPSFEHATENSRLTALVSDDPLKLEQLAAKYNVEHTYSYEQYEDCLRSGEIDAVYIALPNSMHRQFTVQAAKAGIHVLCEKPMAVTESECQQMIEAADENNVKLMVAYRLHFEEANLQAVKLAQSGKLGDVRYFVSSFSQQVKAGDIRLQKALGGGTLYDIGIYCINAARYLFQSEPYQVFAVSSNKGQSRFKEVEEMISVTMRFYDERVATFTCSFGASATSTYHIVGTEGSLYMDPAYEYAEPLHFTVKIDGKAHEHSFPKRDQFGAELVYFSDCVIKDKQPEPSGDEGLADVRIIRALYQSVETGQPVALSQFERDERPGPDQIINKPPVKKPELVHAKSPSGN